MLATVLAAALNLGAVQLVPPLLLGDFGFPEEKKAPEPEPPSGFRGDGVDRQQRVVRPADAPPPIVIEAPTPPAQGVTETLDEAQWQHAHDKWLQLQIDALRGR